MAPLPTISNVVRVAFQWKPINAVNVMHFHQDDPDLAGLWNVLKSHVSANMWCNTASSQTVDHITMTPLDGFGMSEQFIPTPGAIWTGSTGGDAIPASAAVLKLTTVARGRSGRGRLYLGPNSESGVGNGMLVPTVVTTQVNAWTTFQAAMIDDATPQVVASYKNATAFTVLSYGMRQACGTVRMRQSRLAT